ncbi:MAG: DUF4423 domain-containing protein [Bdellovibrionaceae bacterium]|nr:DUF4423 domain-containing protein [Pseudobdellovibrionaceae bacterium]
MKSILVYSDYRRFLRDHAKWKRRENARWSIGVWARTLKLGATTSLTMVLNGQRNPGPSITNRLIEYFNFKAQEREYFLDLVEIAKVRQAGPTDDHLRSLLASDLKKLRLENQSKKLNQSKLVDQRTFLKISSWRCYVIRQMTLLENVFHDPASIAASMIFSTSPAEIEEAINSLLKVGLLRKSKEGRLRRVSKFVKTENDVADEGLKRFHEEMIGHALKAVRKIDVKEREITGLTLAIKRSQIGEAKELIRRFVREFEKLGGQNGADQVSQLNVQFFPITK